MYIEGPRLKIGLTEALQILGTNATEIVFYHLNQRGYTFIDTSKYSLEHIISQLNYLLGDVGAAVIGKALENSLANLQDRK